MLQFLFDTDHLTLFEHRQAAVMARYAAQPGDTVGISAVTVQEYLRGRLAALKRHSQGPLHVRAFGFLVDSIHLLQPFPIVRYDQAADNQYQQLRTLRLHIGTSDTKIGAVALANGLTLVTRNRRDFGQIPGLVIEDWSL
jgi:tRNA(fMet)-specific endonuclease VapC